MCLKKCVPSLCVTATSWLFLTKHLGKVMFDSNVSEFPRKADIPELVAWVDVCVASENEAILHSLEQLFLRTLWVDAALEGHDEVVPDEVRALQQQVHLGEITGKVRR